MLEVQELTMLQKLPFEMSVHGGDCCDWVSGVLRNDNGSASVSSFEESLTLTAIYVSL